jgi:hypothetical protein
MDDDMALRANFYSFDLGKLTDLFGSRKEDVVMRLRPLARDMYPEEPKLVVDHIKRAIRENPPFEDLEIEDEAWVCAGELLTREQEKKYFVEFDWQASSFATLASALEEELSAQARELLTFLAQGRPLFGTAIKTAWSYYAYVTRKEALVLADELRRFGDTQVPQGVARLFVLDLVAVLDSCEQRDADLWMLAS